jgi:hypothetical protein
MHARNLLSRRTLAFTTLAALAGCAEPAVVLDRGTLRDVRRIGVPLPGFHASPTVEVTNAVGRQFGLVGLVSTLVVQSNRSDALAALIRTAGFDPQAYFHQRLLTQVNTLGFTALPEVGDATRADFLASYDAADGHDAVLDVYVSRYGFTAHSDWDSDPYRPSLSLAARLISARDRSVLMQDKWLFKGVDADMMRREGTDPGLAFTTFGDITRRPDLAVTALRHAFDYAVAGIGKRLT